jgi:hypothetical protein
VFNYAEKKERKGKQMSFRPGISLEKLIKESVKKFKTRPTDVIEERLIKSYEEHPDK